MCLLTVVIRLLMAANFHGGLLRIALQLSTVISLLLLFHHALIDEIERLVVSQKVQPFHACYLLSGTTITSTTPMTILTLFQLLLLPMTTALPTGTHHRSTIHLRTSTFTAPLLLPTQFNRAFLSTAYHQNVELPFSLLSVGSTQDDIVDIASNPGASVLRVPPAETFPQVTTFPPSYHSSIPSLLSTSNDLRPP